MSRPRLFIDALPLSTARISGVGYATHGLIKTLSTHPDFKGYDIVLVTTIRGYRFLKLWQFENVRYIKLPLLTRIMNRLPTTPLMPWMDLFLGRGTYIFTNFRSWPLLFSRSITFIHDVGFMIYPENLTKRHLKHLMGNVRKWALRSTMVATVSQASKADIAKYLKLPPAKILVAYNGVDTTDLYPRSAAEIKAARERYHLPASYVLFLGNIEPRKNLVRVIRAYSALPEVLKRRHPLVLIGGGSWMSRQIDTELDHARARGDQIIRPDQYVSDEDRPAVFSGAAALVWPAIYEGFGMPPLEAMATDVPVLTSNVSSLPEVVGDAALTVDPTDEAAITAGLERLLTDHQLRERLIAAGRERIKRFSWDRSLSDLLTWLKQNDGRMGK